MPLLNSRHDCATCNNNAPGTRPTLLIVEDESNPRDSLHVVFHDDYELLHTSNENQVMDYVRQGNISAVILNVRLQESSDIDLLGRIKSHDPNISLIVLSPPKEEEKTRQALKGVPCDYVAKPCDLPAMRAAVARAVERKRYAAQLRKHKERMKDLRTRLTDAQIKEEMARKRSDLYGIVLHDINSPLTVISGLASLAIKQLNKNPATNPNAAAIVKEQLLQIDMQVRRCLDISKHYLSFARRQPSENTSVSLNQVLTDLRFHLRHHPVVEYNEIQIQTVEGNPLVHMHGLDLTQILHNLAINACQCSPTAHKVNIFAQIMESHFSTDQYPDGPHAYFLNRAGFNHKVPIVQVTVQDTGPGIPITPLAHIFEAYYTTKPSGQGTGLGLTIVQQLVEHAHAGLYVESKPGMGTSFNLFLPCHLSEP